MTISKNKIFIYAGSGVSLTSLRHIKYTLTFLLDSHYTIEEITPFQIVNNSWEENAALFVMPGGSDLLYLQSLKTKGNDKICKYVEMGGAYLGLCAGAYYAGNSIQFAMNTPLQVSGNRELNFFAGIVAGPILADYDYHSYSGARVAQLYWNFTEPFPQSTLLNVFYNGGGYFVDAASKKNTIVLASYKILSDFKPAIIKVTYGKGKVILSGVHWEYNPYRLDFSDSHLKELIPQLQACYHQTLELAAYLLCCLGLKFIIKADSTAKMRTTLHSPIK